MPSEDIDFSMSTLSLSSNSTSETEDWDRSLSLDDSTPPSPGRSTRTPRNSVLFPAANGGADDATPGRTGARGKGEGGKRSLSDLMRLHAEKGTDCTFSPEEAARVAEVLRDWINAGSSPYEGEDDFFARGSQDDLAIATAVAKAEGGRPRGHSDSSAHSHSRPPSAAGSIKS